MIIITWNTSVSNGHLCSGAYEKILRTFAHRKILRTFAHSVGIFNKIDISSLVCLLVCVH